MTRRMRVVTPYRPFAPESVEHRELGPFDWVGAIAMLRESVTASCRCETVTITDVDTSIPGPIFQFETTERRLMLWILEVALRYLQSPHFDRDTVMVSPDSLVYCDLRQWFSGDFGIVVRPGHDRPILNSVQWWPVASRDAIITLYRKALKIANALPEDLQVWGADSEPFRILLRPIVAGCGPRKSGLVANLVDSRHILHPLNSGHIAALTQGAPVRCPRGVVEFRYLRKQYMRAFFDAVSGAAVPA